MSRKTLNRLLTKPYLALQEQRFLLTHRKLHQSPHMFSEEMIQVANKKHNKNGLINPYFKGVAATNKVKTNMYMGGEKFQHRDSCIFV